MIPKDLLDEWVLLSTSLSKTKVRELYLRKVIVELMGPASCTKEYYGIELKSTVKVSYGVNKILLEEAALSKEEHAAIKWTPTVIVKMYNQLKGGFLKSSIVTVKPAAPALDIVSREE